MDNDLPENTTELPGFHAARRFRLRILTGEQERRRAVSVGNILTFGSSEEADVQLADPTVSAMHCRLIVEPGGVRVVDLRSKNGTYVGVGRVDNVLLQGARAGFSIGRTWVEIQEDRPEESVDGTGLVGDSPVIREVRERVHTFARLRKPVLILGESGTGKDVVARALHRYSGRAGQYVATNVAAYPDSLIDAELFGYERGAFSGAVTCHAGLFSQAQGGSLFLDEIAELSRAGQAKLLRVVEDGELRALGSQIVKKVDVRLISATCRDLNRMMEDGEFREDMFHRLSLLTIQLPPLRKRLGDIVPLAQHYLSHVAAEFGPKYLPPASIERLKSYHWPGNVRQLYAHLYRAAALSVGEELSPHWFSGLVPAQGEDRPKLYPQKALELLALHENVSAAARAAGVPRSTFRSLLQRAKGD